MMDEDLLPVFVGKLVILLVPVSLVLAAASILVFVVVEALVAAQESVFAAERFPVL